MKSAFSSAFIICFFASVSTFAQERDFLKDMLKESLTEAMKNSIRSEMKTDLLPDNLVPDSTWKTIDLKALKGHLPRLGFNYKLNAFFLSYKDSLMFGPEYTLSLNLTADYRNWEQKYDRTSTETAGDILANVFLRPIASFFMIDPVGVFLYLMDIGVLPNDPLPKRESKHEKALRYITKEIYPNGD